MPPVAQASEGDKSQQRKSSAKEDDRGVSFGTEIAYDDAYGMSASASEYVSELPTKEEEEQRLREENGVYLREKDEMLDEGRISSHPSTMAASRMVSPFYFWRFVCYGVNHRDQNSCTNVVNSFN